MVRFDAKFLHFLQAGGQSSSLQRLQTLPGIDPRGAAMLLAEIIANLNAFLERPATGLFGDMCLGDNESSGKCKSRPINIGQRLGTLLAARNLHRPPGAADAHSWSTFKP